MADQQQQQQQQQQPMNNNNNNNNFNVERLQIGLKDMIAIIIFVFVMAGSWFGTNSKIDSLKVENQRMATKIESVENKFDDYPSKIDLANEVKLINLKIENQNKLINTKLDGIGMVLDRVEKKIEDK